MAPSLDADISAGTGQFLRPCGRVDWTRPIHDSIRTPVSQRWRVRDPPCRCASAQWQQTVSVVAFALL